MYAVIMAVILSCSCDALESGSKMSEYYDTINEHEEHHMEWIEKERLQTAGEWIMTFIKNDENQKSVGEAWLHLAHIISTKRGAEYEYFTALEKAIELGNPLIQAVAMYEIDLAKMMTWLFNDYYSYDVRNKILMCSVPVENCYEMTIHFLGNKNFDTMDRQERELVRNYYNILCTAPVFVYPDPERICKQFNNKQFLFITDCLDDEYCTALLDAASYFESIDAPKCYLSGIYTQIAQWYDKENMREVSEAWLDKVQTIPEDDFSEEEFQADHLAQLLFDLDYS